VRRECGRIGRCARLARGVAYVENGRLLAAWISSHLTGEREGRLERWRLRRLVANPASLGQPRLLPARLEDVDVGYVRPRAEARAWESRRGPVERMAQRPR
jgi:hypothetical protein